MRVQVVWLYLFVYPFVIYIYNEWENWGLFVSYKLSFTAWTIVYMLETEHK